MEAEAITVDDTRRHRHRQALQLQLLAAAFAWIAEFAPHFTAPAAARASARHVDVEGHHGAFVRLPRRHRDLRMRDRRRRVRIVVIAAEVFDGRAGRGKINGDFVGERAPIRALVRHERFER